MLGCLGRPKGSIRETAYRVIADPGNPDQKRATQRHPLQKLAFKSGSEINFCYVWDEAHLKKQAERIVKELPQDNGAAMNQGAPSSVNMSAPPEIVQPLEGAWEKFLLDKELKPKLTNPDFVEAINKQGPPPNKPGSKKKKNETDEQFDKRKEAYSNWESKFKECLRNHKLDGLQKMFILHDPEGKPPKNANTPLRDVLFRREYGVFDRKTLEKNAGRVVDAGIRRQLEVWLENNKAPTIKDWEKFAGALRMKGKGSGAGARVSKVRLWEPDTTLDNYKDLSKDRKHAYYQQTNAKGYWIGVKKSNGKVTKSLFPIRAWDTKASVLEELKDHGYGPYESEPWRWGDVLWVSQDSGDVWKKGFYTFRSADLNGTSVRIDTEGTAGDVRSKIANLLKSGCIHRVPTGNRKP